MGFYGWWGLTINYSVGVEFYWKLLLVFGFSWKLNGIQHDLSMNYRDVSGFGIWNFDRI